MTDVFVDKHSPGQVAYHLMDIDQNLRSILPMEGNRFNVGVDLAPLFGPIGADGFRPMDKAAFERLRPAHIGSHEHESGTDVTRIEGCVRCAEQVDFLGSVICHEW